MAEPREPVQITLPEDFYGKFDQAIVENLGMPFTQLAEERPADAYKAVMGLARDLAESTDTVTTLDGKTVSKDMDGAEATHGAARHAIESSKIDTDIEPVDVVVSVLQTPRFRDMIRGRKTQPKQVASFHVDPPNLAF